ncbi:MAG: hypothetical protein JWN04_6504, partial [Myxococcaceae bacterium]|nr:hypothetical protein [Myxococcaceae bacterium]
RAKFDKAVLDSAVRAGAKFEAGVRVSQIECDETGVSLQTSAGARRARYVIDATGQDA